MHSLRSPVLKPVRVADLRPTQMTVGLREVEAKVARWRSMDDQKMSKFLGRHMMPAILGPNDRHYIIDHHHMSRALYDAGIETVLVTNVADLRGLSKDEFWTFIDNRGWLHPFDAEGRRCAVADLPKSVADLADDPYRSLTGELRRTGGFAKDTTPFSEFLWADFLRRRIKRKAVRDDFGAALKSAQKLAKSMEAGHLPGWCGPVAEDS